MCCIARADWTILYSIIISVLNYWWTAFIKVSNWPFSEHEHRPAHSTRITCHSVKRPLGSKKILMCRERSCFSKLCPSNIYRSCVRFGKLQAEYSPPPVCQGKHPAISAWFHLTLSVWKQTFPLQRDVASRPGSYIFFDFVLTHLEHQMRKVYCMETVRKMVTTFKSILESQLLSCNCLLIHIILQSHQTGTCID